jgi:UDP-N-acetylmuramoyl-L-alanyl-D-glutamate--2,6-diaminopimelate ligase
MMLEELIAAVQPKSVVGEGGSREVAALRCDSRRVCEGDVFFALRGEKVDGHEHIADALQKGAAAVVAELPGDDENRGEATWLQVRDGRVAMGIAADAYYDHPSHEIGVIGITGTNGKTTTTFLTHHVVQSSWRRCGMMGTVFYDNGEHQEVASNTTPESIEVHRLLGEMRDNACRAAVMEVSSHGISQHRTTAVRFRVAVFTNLSRDHLDYHGSFENYFAAKRMLFEQVEQQSSEAGLKGNDRPVLVINGDDKYGRILTEGDFSHTRIVTYGQGVNCDFRISNIRSDFNGTTYQLEIGKQRSMLVRLPLIGRYNVMNATAALAAAQGLGVNLREAVKNIQEAPQVPGRLEAVEPHRTAYKVYVDYAHTDDALINALQTLRDLRPARIITVFGCGGDRDRKKRPLMGKAAEENSDVAIITSDNPRSENPEAILRDVEKGMRGNRYVTMADRREAIREAIRIARVRDIVLIAGKGHEDYQEINGERNPFDDRVEVRHAINDRIEEEVEQRREREREENS